MDGWMKRGEWVKMGSSLSDLIARGILVADIRTRNIKMEYKNKEQGQGIVRVFKRGMGV